MALSYFVPIGLLIAVVGLVVYFVTKRKKIAIGIIGFGLMVTLGTVALIILAVNSM